VGKSVSGAVVMNPGCERTKSLIAQKLFDVNECLRNRPQIEGRKSCDNRNHA
jgi:hypothetical protein